MDILQLRRRVGAILAVEQARPRDWAEVERLIDELQRELMREPDTQCPEIVDHYLDDSDIRATDEAYGQHQRDKVSRFVETGEHEEGTTVSPWACAVVVALIVALIAWLLW